MLQNTTLIVLKKQPHQESNLLISGLSPDFGKLSLVVYGAQKISEKKYPVADLFRELEATFDDKGESDLFSAKELELATDFSAVAEDARLTRFTGKIAQFLLKNCSYNLPVPYTYDVFRNLLVQLLLPSDLPERWTMEQSAVLVKLAWLYENGLFPEISDAKQSELLESLLSAGIEGGCLPDLAASYYQQLNQWLNSLLDYHQIVR